MSAEIDHNLVKEKVVELAFAARTVVQQLVARDRTAEGFAAQGVLEDALTKAIVNGGEHSHPEPVVRRRPGRPREEPPPPIEVLTEKPEDV